jgi:hypothetical protein
LPCGTAGHRPFGSSRRDLHAADSDCGPKAGSAPVGSRGAATGVRDYRGTRPKTVEEDDLRSCHRRPLTLGFSCVFPGPQHHAVPSRMAGTDLARRKPGVQIPSPPPPTSQVRASPASSRRRSLPAAAAPRPHAQVAAQPRRLAATRRLGPGPHTMTTQRSRHLAAHPGSPPTGDPRAHPANPGRPRGRPGHCTTTSHDDGQVQADPSADPADLRQSRPPGSDSGRRRTGRGHGGRPRRRRPSQPCGCCPPPPSTTSRPDTVDAGGHGHRTPTPDA